MTLPMMLTCSRMALAPVFYLLYKLAEAVSPLWLIGVWVVFILIEVSDLLDGRLARRLGQESELGKVLDPLADSLSRLSYFVAFAGSGILPPWILLILVYRDISVAYIRVMVSKDNVLMPARASGKIKAWIYAGAGVGGIGLISLRNSGLAEGSFVMVEAVVLALFLAASAVALWSLADYAVFFFRNFMKTS